MEVGHRWRDYRNPTGRGPVKEFIDALSDEDAANVAAAMAEAREEGLSAARHLRGEIYEVRAEGNTRTIRILFAPEGRKARILLALEGFTKKTQKTPYARNGQPRRARARQSVSLRSASRMNLSVQKNGRGLASPRRRSPLLWGALSLPLRGSRRAMVT